LNTEGDAWGGRPPRILSQPADAVSTSGQEIIDLYHTTGAQLDPWQEESLRIVMGERRDGSWACSQVGIEAPRQNGKGAILEARQLGGLFLLREPLQVHTAHVMDTCMAHFDRVLSLIESTPDLARQVTRVSRSHGDLGIESGPCRLKFRARTGRGGRGLTAPVIYLDEAQELSTEMLAALSFILSAVPDHQLWMTGSCGAIVNEVWNGMRATAMKGTDPRLAYLGWAADPAEAVADPLAEKVLRESNPAHPARITRETIEAEYRLFMAADDIRSFLRERLGVWDDDIAAGAISLELWAAQVSGDVTPSGVLTFGLDVSPSRDSASIAVCDGAARAELIVNEPGTSWVVGYLERLTLTHGSRVVLDKAGPAGSMVPDLANAGVTVTELDATDLYRSGPFLLDGLESKRLRIRSHSKLDAAVAGAVKRENGDRWRWDRRVPSIDVTPLVAVTLAFWGACGIPVPPPEAVTVFD